VGTHPKRGDDVLTFETRFRTHEDYLAWVDTRPDEERYEVVEGVPVMSPGPSLAHQRCIGELHVLLRSACPNGLEVLFAPFDWVLWESPWLQVRQPDLLVAATLDLESRAIRRAPVLAVEVLSPGSGERDLFAKPRDYARARLQHYWVVDPAGPQVAVYRLVDGELRLSVDAIGNTEIVLDEPFPVRFRPTDLVPAR
jgi:Uma2 family endonuclease